MAKFINSNVRKGEEINISRILDMFRKRWYFILLSLLLSLMVAKLYLRYTKPIFVAAGTIKIEEKNTATSTLGYLPELEDFKEDIQSEMQILNSRKLILEALKQMDLDVTYFKIGRVKRSEMYRTSPFRVVYDTASAVPYSTTFILTYIGNNEIAIRKENSLDEGKGQRYLFGENIDIDGFRFRINTQPSLAYPLIQDEEYSFKINKLKSLIGRARSGMKVEQVGYMVSILRISSRDYAPYFPPDFVNSLCQVYLEYNEDNQRAAATQALTFIETQLDSLQDSLHASERAIERFLVGNEMVSVETKEEEEIGTLQTLRTSMAQLEVKDLTISRLEKEVETGRPIETMALAIVGHEAPNLANLITGYNELQQERMTALERLTPQHPKIQEMDLRLDEKKESIYTTIRSIRAANSEQKSYYDREIAKYKKSLLTLPATRRGYVSLLREYEVRNKIFNNLLEKRAEAQIARESIIPAVRILDEALVPSGPMSPRPQKVYMMAFTAGISLGIILIVASMVLKNIISYRDEVEAISLTPVIGVVGRSNVNLNHKYPRLQSIENPKSSLSESIRAIRTNLQFISSDKESKIISITSTVSGEGKSFITINLGGIISILNKKVVILDFDLRKPKLHYSFGLDNSVGLSTFLVGKSDMQSIIKPTEYANLSVISSGPIPPNPAELAQSVKLEELLVQLRKEFDYILIDTPPIGLVTDGTTLLKLSDIALYVVRADYSKKSYARIPDQLAEEQKIKNLYIILNSVNKAGGRYSGYGYRVYSSGYYSDDSIKYPWWQFWKVFKRGGRR